MQSSNKLTKKTIIFLLLILLLGFALRFSLLDKQDYWLDEGFTLITAEKNTFSEVTNSVLFYETAPPLYLYILNIWIKLFGNSPSATRSLSAIFGTISILFVFSISRKIADQKISLLTAFLFSVSMINIWVAQEVRPYSFFIFLTLLSTLFLANILKSNKTHNYLFYFFSLIALLYTSYFSVFVIFFHFMLPLFLKRYSLLKKIFPLQFIAVSLLIPWIIIAFPKSNLSTGIVYELLFYHAGLPKFIAQFGQLALISPLILLTFLTIVIYFVNLKRPFKVSQRVYEVIAAFTLLSLVVYTALIINFQTLFVKKALTWARYFIFLLPAGHFIISKTIYKMSKKFRAYFVIFSISLSFFALYAYYSSTLKEEWTPAINFIEHTRNSQEGIIFIDEGGANMYLINYYYKGSMESIELAWKDKTLTIENVKDITHNKEFAWLILSRNWKRGDYYKVLFDGNFNRIREKEFNGIKLYLYSTLDS